MVISEKIDFQEPRRQKSEQNKYISRKDKLNVVYLWEDDSLISCSN